MQKLAKNWPIVANGILLMTFNTVCFYLITVYTPTFGSAVLHLAARDAMVVTLSVGLSNFIWIPIMGALSDRVGRLAQLAAICGLALLTAYPALYWLASGPSFARLMTVELWFSILFAGYNGAMSVILSEIMPADVRTTGFSFAHSFGSAVFGGFTPTIATYLIHTTGNRAIPALWLSFAAVCGFVAIAMLRASDARKPLGNAIFE